MRSGGVVAGRALVALLVLGTSPAGADHKAPSPYDVKLEGEAMSLPPPNGSVQNDGAASGGQALRILNGTPAVATVTTTRPTDHLFLRAKGQVCIEVPRVSVKIDGVERFNDYFNGGAYQEKGVRVSLSAGTHDVEIRLTNDFYMEIPGSQPCDRNMVVDKLTLVATPFSAGGWRNQPLSASAPIASNSAQMVQDIADQMDASAAAGHPEVWVSTDRWTVPIYTVPHDQPTVKVEHVDNDASLETQWANVPIPEGAKPAEPPWNPTLRSWGDANMLVWQPSTNTLWEFFHMRRNDPVNPTGWTADYGGRMENVSSHVGQFEDPPGQQFGSSATSISLLATIQRIEELERGVIDHAIGMTITGARGYDGWCWPAHRTDRQHWRRTASAIPAGTRFRLPASFDFDAWTAAHPMNPYGLMVAKAIQKYGLVISDSGQGIGFATEDPTPTGDDPFYRQNGSETEPDPNGPFAGEWPDQGGVFRNFPWEHLQALAQPSGAGLGCFDDPDITPPNDNNGL